MKAILEFNLPEDQHELDKANAATRLCSVLWDFDQYLRSEIKYKDKPLDEVREKLYEVMNSEGIDLERLYI